MLRFGPRATVLAAAAAIAIFAGRAAVAAPDAGWLAQRQAAFARWQAAHPRLDRELAALKGRTANLVRQRKLAVGRKADAEHAGRLARSRALGPGQAAQLADLLAAAAARSKAGDCAGAEPLFRQAIDLDPANGWAYYGLGHCLRLQGQATEAARYLTQATRFPDPSHDADTYYTKAMMELQPLPPPPDPRIDEPPAILRVPGAPTEIWDAAYAPRMSVIPAGEFTMGSPLSDPYREPSEGQHRVLIGYPFAVSTADVTRGEFAAFVADTGYDARGDGCEVAVRMGENRMRKDPRADWSSPGFLQADDDPVVCMNYLDGVAYTAWLTRKTGHRYRLASEAEFEYATRAGTTTVYHWGDEITPGHATCDGCNDAGGPVKPTPRGTYPPNAFGLYDMSGNVWKWIEDCWNNTYDGAPNDGSAWEAGNCALRGKRSGSWFNTGHARPGDFRPPTRLRSAARFGATPELRVASFGLRVVREID